MANWAEAILSPLRTASGLLQEAIDLRDTVKLGDVSVKLMAQILAAQQAAMQANSEHSALTEKISALEHRISELEAWDVQEERYELKQLHRGPFAHLLKEGQEAGEEPHALCTNCYQHKFKSHLQMSGDSNIHSRTWFCPSCKMTVKGQWGSMADWIKRTRNSNAA
jgi:hypothetical protein